MFMKNKKGQSLSLNTIKIAIIVLVVLVILIAFFAGGAGTIIQKIKGIFGLSTAGTDLQMARNACEQYCGQAKEMYQNSPELVQNSAYCTKAFQIDWDNDGTADKFSTGEHKGEFKNFYCGYVAAGGIKANNDELKDIETLQVDCTGISC